MIVGLAPGAHGANRTGRMFTGDRSGDWLYRAMHKAGFATKARSTSQDDGLELRRCVITSVCHCAPPQNKPTPEEIDNCRPFLDQTIQLCKATVFLALGQLAWKSVVRHSIRAGWLQPPHPKFGHGVEIRLNVQEQKPSWLMGCFHPSQQNTFTGRLTVQMLDDVFRRINILLD